MEKDNTTKQNTTVKNVDPTQEDHTQEEVDKKKSYSPDISVPSDNADTSEEKKADNKTETPEKVGNKTAEEPSEKDSIPEEKALLKGNASQKEKAAEENKNSEESSNSDEDTNNKDGNFEKEESTKEDTEEDAKENTKEEVSYREEVDDGEDPDDEDDDTDAEATTANGRDFFDDLGLMIACQNVGGVAWFVAACVSMGLYFSNPGGAKAVWETIISAVAEYIAIIYFGKSSLQYRHYSCEGDKEQLLDGITLTTMRAFNLILLIAVVLAPFTEKAMKYVTISGIAIMIIAFVSLWSKEMREDWKDKLSKAQDIIWAPLIFNMAILCSAFATSDNLLIIVAGTVIIAEATVSMILGLILTIRDRKRR